MPPNELAGKMVEVLLFTAITRLLGDFLAVMLRRFDLLAHLPRPPRRWAPLWEGASSRRSVNAFEQMKTTSTVRLTRGWEANLVEPSR